MLQPTLTRLLAQEHVHDLHTLAVGRPSRRPVTLTRKSGLSHSLRLRFGLPRSRRRMGWPANAGCEPAQPAC